MTGLKIINIINIRCFICLLCLLLYNPAQGQDKYSDDVKELDRKVKGYLADEDYPAAIDAYIKVCKKYSLDLELRNGFSQLYNLYNVYKSLDEVEDDSVYIKKASRLRRYFYSKGVYSVALKYDLESYQRQQDPVNTENLLESLILLDKNQKAQEIFDSAEEKTLRVKTFGLLLKARTGQVETAVREFKEYDIKPENNPLLMFDFARIAILAECDDLWVEPLIYSLRYSDLSAIETLKNMILACAEFAELHENDVFIYVLQTPSRGDQFICPTGKDCSKCKAKE